MRAFALTMMGCAAALLGSVDGRAQAPVCVAHHQPFVEGGLSQGQIRVANDGQPCGFTFKFGGNFEPSDWKVETAPRHGHVDIGGGIVNYVPDAGYAGADDFTVAVFGYNPMLAHGRRARDGRFHISVEVRPAHGPAASPG